MVHCAKCLQKSRNYEQVVNLPSAIFRTVVPNRGSWIPRGPKQDFAIGMFLDVHFFKRTELYESLPMLLLEKTLSSLINHSS